MDKILPGRAPFHNTPDAVPRQIQLISVALLILALWMTTRPYQGIFHDSRFYTVEALNDLLPGRFSQDLYFQYGSQGRFTIFSLFYRPLIAFLGLSGGNIALTIVAQCLWLGGLCYLSSVLFRDWKQTSAAVAAVILLPSGSMFHYGEPFLTPRPFAEALTFWALGSQFRGRPVRALGMLGISMFIHPLMTLPGLAVWFLYEAMQRRILWLVAAIAVAIPLGLALAGVQPFSWLFIRIDPSWFEIVWTRDDFCFVTQWKLDRWLPIGGSFVLGLFELALAIPPERRVLIPVFIVGAAGILLSLVGGDILHNVLLFDIQTWRAMWLFTVFANLFAVKMLIRFARARPVTSSPTLWFAGLALGLMAIAQFFVLTTMGAVMLLALAVFAVFWEWVAKQPLSRSLRIPLAVLVGCSLTALLIGAEVTVNEIDLSPTFFWQTLNHLVLSFCIALVIWFLLFRSDGSVGKRMPPAAFLAVALALTAIAGWQWDQRTAWTRFVDASVPPASLTELLPGNAPIYWEGDVATPWFLLKRASYFSCDQGTGALFSRDTALAYGKRYKNLQKLQTLDFRQYTFCPLTEKRRSTPLQRAELSGLCTKEKELGALVLTEHIADAPYRLWVSPAPYQAVERSADGEKKFFRADHFYIYDCAELR